MDLQQYREELQPLIPLKGGGSYQLMYQMLRDIRLLKYVTQAHLKELNPRYTKICSKKKLNTLVDLGYLEGGDVYIATDKVIKLLRKVDYNVKLLPNKPKGKGGENELNNTAVFIRLLDDPLYKALLYPQFPKDNPFIIPDGLFILADDKRYKLVFIEVQINTDPKILERKRANYERLAKSDLAFKYWKGTGPQLGLKVPAMDDFKFTVWCYADTDHDWPGWTFKEMA